MQDKHKIIKMSRIIAIANHKGGVGKTASVAAIGAILASKGFKVLLIDLDTQANLTMHFMPEMPQRTIFNAIQERNNLPVYSIRENLCLVPSCLDMAGIELQMSMMKRREYVLSDLMKPYKDNFDFIILDCPPSLGLVTMNALAIAEILIVPMLADIMSSYGVEKMEKFCNEMQDLNQGLHIDYIFFNRYEKRQNMTIGIENNIRTMYGDKVLKTVIRKNVDIAESAAQYTDVVSYNPESIGAKDFQELVNELLERVIK